MNYNHSREARRMAQPNPIESEEPKSGPKLEPKLELPDLDEDKEIDHLVSQYSKDPTRFIPTIQGELLSVDEILLQHRTDAIAIHEAKSNGLDIDTSAEQAKAQVESLLNKARLESALEEAKLGLAISGKYEHRQHFKARIKILGDELTRLKSKGAK